jgi:hypothetical protein
VEKEGAEMKVDRRMLASVLGSVLAVFSLGLWLLSRVGLPSPVEARGDQAMVESKLSSLALELEELRSMITRIEGELLVDEGERVAVPQDDEPLHAKLETLQGVIEDLEGELYAWMEEGAEARLNERIDRTKAVAETQLTRDALAAYQASVQDPSLNINGRLVALKMLTRFPEEMNATEPVMETILDLLLQPYDGQRMERVVDAVGNTADGRLVPIYRHLLETSNDQGLRLEIVRNLRGFKDVPEAGQILRQIADEEEGKPRVTAKAILESWREGRGN